LTGPLAGGNRFPRPAVSPDGRTVYYIARVNDPESGFSLIALDVETRATRELYSVRSPRMLTSVAVSPDGRRLALLTTGNVSQKPEPVSMTISFMPASGGEPREIFRTESPSYEAGYEHGIEWTADGQYLLASVPSEFGHGEKFDVVRIPADGGETVSLGVPVVWGNRFRFPSAHPDGRRVAFDTSFGGELPGELWVLENFLPQEPASE
jgi:Tol biopolymer transport system component